MAGEGRVEIPLALLVNKPLFCALKHVSSLFINSVWLTNFYLTPPKNICLIPFHWILILITHNLVGIISLKSLYKYKIDGNETLVLPEVSIK